MLSRLLVFVCAIGFVCAASVQAQTVWHVDDDASTNGDGLTWGTAYKYLQDALAASSDGDEIRIAGGIYKPDQDEGGIVTPGDRSETFQMVLGVPIYGGYAGLANPGSPDERNIDGYVTILSGDLAGNDGPDFAGYDENSYRVVTGHSTDSAGRLDGVTVSGGNYTGGPGGASGLRAFFYNTYPDPKPRLTLDDCTFADNLGTGAGLTSNLWDGTATVTNCTFTGNKEGPGLICVMLSGTTEVTDCVFTGNLAGGMDAAESKCALTRCTFIGNLAGSGGAADFGQKSASLVDCVFIENFASLGGGALYARDGAGVSATNCLFAGNWTAGNGGVIYLEVAGAPSIANCTFVGNSAESGSVVYTYFMGSATLVNCIVWDNDEPQIVDGESRGTTATYSDIQGNWPGEGNINVDPLFADPDGPDGNPDTFEDNDYRLATGSPCVDTGDNAAVTTTTDLAGNPRIVDGDLDGTPTVDMGVYECQENCARPPIPTVSEWGLVVMAVLVLGAGAMIFQKRRNPRSAQ